MAIRRRSVDTQVAVTALKTAAERLRARVLAAGNGARIGSEDSLVVALGFSRSTIRQAARLLEREGLLRVRRGINGGYFGSRPDANTIEATVGAYLETLDVDVEDVTAIASALWIEVLRKAAAAPGAASRALADEFRGRVLALAPGAPFAAVLKLEQDSRTAIFELSNSRYIELIFHINSAFAARCFAAPPGDGPRHRAFVRAWRDAKLMELGAIAEGDAELGVLAARHIRNIWNRRVYLRHGRRRRPRQS